MIINPRGEKNCLGPFVRAIARELGTTPSETSLTQTAFFVDFVGRDPGDIGPIGRGSTRIQICEPRDLGRNFTGK